MDIAPIIIFGIIAIVVMFAWFTDDNSAGQP